MKRLIIGCGYLGERVARKWAAAGDEVYALTRQSARIDAWRPLGISGIRADIMQPETLIQLPVCDTVLYAVARGRDAAYSQRELYLTGLQNTLEALGERFSRFVYVSSTSVYGQSDGSMVTADSVTAPESTSGQTCLAAEQNLADWFRSRHAAATWCVLRSAGIYGPQRLLRRIESLRNREPITTHPQGWLNLIHVDDLVTAAVQLSDMEPVHQQTYLACDDQPLKREEYYQLLARLTNCPPPVFESSSKAMSLGKRCCNQKLKDRINWRLSYPGFEVGLPSAVAASDIENW